MCVCACVCVCACACMCVCVLACSNLPDKMFSILPNKFPSVWL